MEGGLPTEKYSEYKKIVQEHPLVKRIDRMRAREHGHDICRDKDNNYETRFRSI